MTPIDPDRWRMISPLLDRALDFETDDERERWLATLHERDPAAGSDVAALVAEHLALAREGYLERGAPAPPGRAATLAGQTIGPYTLVSPIGHGGMGAVWLGRRSDGRFDRQVAVKFLSIALGHRGEARFTREGAILGRLVHPHVAQLIDAGVSPGGQPYLILEYVDGVHIDRYCRNLGLDVNACVRLFLDVLDAVASAHASLIVHRDLKPSNVLVDRSGQVKLLDFGIAKLMEDEGASGAATLLTREGGSALTPAYAAPEQITSDPITTATDVYSLGVLLYVLVTGEHPAGENPTSAASMVTAILETMPRRLPDGDLGTVLGKALKKAPKERYASVTAFADDLRRFLNHEPIAARPDTLTYRSAKFVERHRVGVAVAIAALAGLSIALYAVNRQRALAQRRFTEVRQLAAKLFDVDAQVRQLPGNSRTRQLIVDTSLDYLRRLTPDAGDDPDLALDVGTAYMRVARVEGVPISANLGQVDRADEHLRTAQAFIDRVVAAQPANRTAMLRAAQVAHDRMIVADQRHLDDEAYRFAQISNRYLEEYLRTGSAGDDTYEQEQVLITYMNVANRYLIAGHREDAIRMLRRTIDLAHGVNQPLQAAAALTVVARAEVGRGRLEEALTAAHEASRILEPPADGKEELLPQKMVYSLALSREASILDAPGRISLGRPADAIPLLERALDLGEAAAKRDASETVSRQRVAMAGLALGSIVRESDPERALKIFDRVIQRMNEIRNSAAARANEVRALAGSTYSLRALRRPADARTRLDAAFAKLAELKRYPGVPVKTGSEADDAMTAQAEFEAAQGNVGRAIEIYRRLLDLLAAGGAKPETDLADAADLSRLQASLAALERRAGRPADAGALDARRVKIWEIWAKSLPDNPFVARQLAASAQ